MSKIPHRLWFRFLAGEPLDGHYRTDARFLTAGSKQLGRLPVRRWSYRPGYQRAGVRLGTVTGVSAAVWGSVTHPMATALSGGLLTALGTVYGVWRAHRGWVRRKVFKLFERPLHAVLSPLLGLPAPVRPRDYITVPPTYRDREDTPVLIRLPDAFAATPGNRQSLTDAVLPKLHLSEDTTDVIFRMVGHPVMVLKMAPQPPDMVPWDDYAELMESLPTGKIFVGCGPRGKPYIRDYHSGENVHGGYSVQTGFGKSAAMMGWIAQVLRQDPRITVRVIDPKRSALPAAMQGVPGYYLANNPENVWAMWDLIYDFEDEMKARMKLRENDPTMEFPLMFLYIDELSEFMDMTREAWDMYREDCGGIDQSSPEEKRKLPKRAPVIRSWASILRMSREFGGRVNVFTQRLDTQSTGMQGLRDLLGERGLAGYKRNQWMMLIGSLPIPKSVNHRGRWIYSDGFTERWVQNVYGTPEQLRDWAMGDRRVVDTQLGHTPARAALPAGTTSSVQWEVIGLQAAAERVGLPVETFRKRRRAHPIDGEGNVGRSPAWMGEHLDKWLLSVSRGITESEDA